MQVKFVDLGMQYISLRAEILNKIDEISSKGAYVLGSELKSFEENFAKYCGTKYAIGVANATDALFLVMKALGIKQGDEVITAPNSFIATAGAIAATGAKPVFVDIREDYNINPNLIERAITERTKAILPVHLTGRPAALDEIISIAQEHGLAVIEDAAQAIGATYRGKRVGSFGVAGCFSLHPLKNLHVHGDGGVITTNNEELYKKLTQLRNHGLKNRDECEIWGYNSRLDQIQAAIANIKLKYIDQWNQQRREFASFYKKELEDIVEVPRDQDHEQAVYHLFITRVSEREKLQSFLTSRGVDTKVHYPIPIHLQSPGKELGYKEGDFPVTEAFSKTILSLPIHTELTHNQIAYAASKIREFYNKN